MNNIDRREVQDGSRRQIIGPSQTCRLWAMKVKGAEVTDPKGARMGSNGKESSKRARKR